MKGGNFIMDGVESSEYNLFIQRTPLLETPSRKMELRDAFGVDGGIPFDERAYNNTQMQLLMFIDGKDANKDREKVDGLLRNTGVYKEFIPYFDPTKIYYVMTTESVKYETRSWYYERQALEANLTVKPYKYLRNVDDITFATSGTAVNPFLNDIAQPIITVYGTGDITLRVNGKNYLLQNVDGHITVNSERYITYKELSSGLVEDANTKYRQKEYPIFTPGSNSISTTGNVTQVRIEPRWRSLS